MDTAEGTGRACDTEAAWLGQRMAVRKTSFGVLVLTPTYRTRQTANVENRLAAVGRKETEAQSWVLTLVVAT